MVAPLVAAGAISAGSSIISGIGNLFSANKQRKSSKELAKYAYMKDLEQWHRANAYNDPSQQMARLKKAGLNPNMVYGTGTATGNTQVTTPKHQVPDSTYPQMDIPQASTLQMLNQYQDYKNKKVTHDNLGKQTELMEKESELRTLNMMKTAASTAKTTSETKRINKLMDNQYNVLEQNVIQNRMKTNMMSKDWQLYQQGIRPNDSVILRQLFQKQNGKNIWQRFKQAL